MFREESANTNAVRKETKAKVLTMDQPKARRDRLEVMESPQIVGAMMKFVVVVILGQ